jgi:hypothetical protein
MDENHRDNLWTWPSEKVPVLIPTRNFRNGVKLNTTQSWEPM